MTGPVYFRMEPTLYRKTKWLRFMLVDRKPKTVVRHVVNKSGKILGKISWLAQWRQYTFDPEAYTTFNNGCLQDITDVLTSLNSEHKNNNLAKDGIYLLRDPSGYEKTVEASFDGNGKLERLVDKDGNTWIKWANDVIWTEPRESHQ